MSASFAAGRCASDENRLHAGAKRGNLSEVFVAQAAALATFGLIVGKKQRERRITVAGQSLCAIRRALQHKLFKKAARKRQQEQGEIAMSH